MFTDLWKRRARKPGFPNIYRRENRPGLVHAAMAINAYTAKGVAGKPE